jgi:hypothetical protein
MSQQPARRADGAPEWTTVKIRLMVLAGLCLVVLSMIARWSVLPEAGSAGLQRAADPGAPSLQRARAVLGPPPSGGQWHSGIWAGGGTARTSRVEAFGRWRGTVADAATMYPADTSWQSMHDSHWHLTTYAGFDGTLVYGLPMLPDRDKGDFGTIMAGDHDWVYRGIAQDLVDEGRERSIVRIGWEANGDWFPWHATAATAAQYVAAYRHIVDVLHSVAPELVIDFDIACGTRLPGQQDRLDALMRLYPGDDVVDIVGCDSYDWYHTKARNELTWPAAIRPVDRPGIADVAQFARQHGKGLSIPEWGLASTADGGLGDNPFYVEKMRSFFTANADVLVLESYFSEPDTSLANSIWDPDQNPQSSAVYASLW